MIGLTSRGKSFSGLAGYLTLGQDRKSPERVAWMSTRNLATNNPHVAAHLMNATAALSKRVQKPVYHLAISWDEKDKPSPQEMASIMDKSLECLGLSGHQALYVAHSDTDHAHVHAMINRVHDETGKAWDGKKDHYKLRETLIQLEKEYGFVATPIRSMSKAKSATKEEIAIATREDRPAFTRMAKDHAGKLKTDLAHTFLNSKTIADLDRRLERRGLTLTRSGNGFRVLSGEHYAKLGDLLPQTLNTKKLKERLGNFKTYFDKKSGQRALKQPNRKLTKKRTANITNAIDL